MPLVRRAAEAGSTAGLEDSLQAAVAGILGRDPRGVVFVSFWAPNATLEVATALVLGCGKSGQPEALPTLADLLDGRSELAPVLLQEIGILATIAPKPIAADVLDPVRRILEENEGPLLREAAIALGRAQDPAAAGRLIELLGHEDRGVRSAAEWALEALSSLRFGSNAERWSAWLRGETQWLREDAARMRREIQSPTPEVALRALSEMCRHRLRRHELALVGTPALAHHDPLVRRLACLALAQLGSTAAVPALRMTLADGDAEVVDAARRALATLEG
jgi:HEAT repeat protein